MTELREVRQRIQTTGEIRKMTSALQMIASIRLQQHRREVAASNRYTDKLRELLGFAASRRADFEHPLLRASHSSRAALIVFGSDRGLCGAFNTELVREATTFVHAHPGLRLLVCGRVAGRRLAALHVPEMKVRRQPGGAGAVGEVSAIADDICRWFVTEEVGSVHVLYHSFKNAISVHPVIEQVLPLSQVPGSGGPAPSVSPRWASALVEPSARELIEWLIPEWMNRLVQNAFLNSLISESAARQHSMSRASENAGTMVEELTMHYRRLRQEGITQEMLELSGGTLV